MLGKTVKHYRIVNKLGSGGMGDVYVAENLHLETTVALKFLPPHLCRDEVAKERFVQEAKTASGLNHPNVCTIHDIDQGEDGQLFIAMALYEGQTLREKLQDGALPVEEAIDIARQVAEGLAVAHEKGIIHRDIKPANILITERGRAVILDFGLAKLQESTAILTESGSTLGTAAYMSPEQARGEPVDHRTDIWSLGVVLYEMLAGERPFKADYQQALVYQILNAEVQSIAELVPDVPDALALAVDSSLRKDAGDRSDSASALAHALSGSPIAIVNKRTRRRVSRRAMAAVAAVGILIVLAAVFYASTRSPGVSVTEPQSAFVVLPFGAEGDDRMTSATIMTLLSASLNGIPGVRSIDPNAVLPQLGDDYLDRAMTIADGQSLADRFGAGGFILGSVLRLGDNLHLTARLYDDASEGPTEAVVVAPDTTLILATEELVAQLLAGHLDAQGLQMPSLAAQTTTSYAALQAFMEGEEAYFQMRYVAAFEHYDRATQADSMFALAWYRRYQAAGWSKRLRDKLDEALEGAMSHRDRLSPTNRRLVEATDMIATCESEDARLVLNPLVAREPDNAWAWFLLGEVAWHCNAIDGRTATDAKPFFQNALELNRGFEEAKTHLVDIAIEERDFELAAAVNAERPAEHITTTLRLILAQTEDRRRALADSMTRAYSRGRNNGTHFALVAIYQMPRLAQLYAEYIPFPSDRARRQLSAIRDAMSGRIASHLQDTTIVYAHYLWEALLYYPANHQEILRYKAGFRAAESHSYWAYNELRRHFALGLHAWRLGDLDAVRRSADSLAALPDTTLDLRKGPALSQVLRALQSRSEDDIDSALAHLNKSRRPVGIRETHWDQRIARFVRAEILRESSRYEDAIRWYRSVVSGPDYGSLTAVSAPTLYRLGECHDRVGDTEEAIYYYTRFIELWQKAEPRLQPWVNDALGRVDQLVEQRSREPRTSVG